MPGDPPWQKFSEESAMTAALETRSETTTWFVPDYKIDGVTWYEPGEYVNPETGEVEGDVMCTL
ncbi:hypothetical protein EEB12_21055 [Rhodococcus sp. WS1]|nr:hypothetical protein EEB12_21055 [Rhodococcus sp. WS1]